MKVLMYKFVSGVTVVTEVQETGHDIKVGHVRWVLPAALSAIPKGPGKVEFAFQPFIAWKKDQTVEVSLQALAFAALTSYEPDEDIVKSYEGFVEHMRAQLSGLVLPGGKKIIT